MPDDQPQGPLFPFQGPLDIRSLALTGLFVLALLAALRIARSFFLPVTAAVLISFTLKPVVDSLIRMRLSRPIAAALVVGALVGTFAFGVRALYEPATGWIRNAPTHLSKLEHRLRTIREPIEQMEEATEAVERIGGGDDGEPSVAVRRPKVASVLAAGLGTVAGHATVVVVLLYFLLAAGDVFLAKIVEVLPRFRDKRRAVEIMRRIETDVSRYLMTITAINILLGLAVAAVMAALGMPSPFLWGTMATFLNFVPVLGAVAGTAIISGVAILTFDTLSRALVVPAAFLLITGLEGLFLTPAVLGQRLTLNPVFVFLALLAGSWLWGIPGALVAVPLLVVLKILFDGVERLRFIGRLMEH